VRQTGFAMLLCFCLTMGVHAADGVIVESREFRQGQSSCELGIYVSNNLRINGIVLPFELREITPGAFPASGLIWVENPDGRIYQSYLGAGVGLASRTKRYYPTHDGTPCSGPVSGTYNTNAASVDYLSPDGAIYVTHVDCQAPIGDPCWLEPGDEIPGTNEPSYLLRFNAGMTTGQFEVDTCCIRPANHLMFIDAFTTAPILPSFTKGIVTIVPCTCPCTADPVCDGVTDVNDVASVIDVAFRGVSEFTDSTCLVARTDVNADWATDVVDVVRTVYVAFYGQSASTYFTNPCE